MKLLSTAVVATCLAISGCDTTYSNEVEWTLDNYPSSETRGQFHCKFSSSRTCRLSLIDRSGAVVLTADVGIGQMRTLQIPTSADVIRVVAYIGDRKDSEGIDLLPGKISQSRSHQFRADSGV